MNTPNANYYSASRNQLTGRFVGWVQFRGDGPLTYTRGNYATRGEALKAIRAQHPDSDAEFDHRAAFIAFYKGYS